MIEYKKLLHFLMLEKSAQDTGDELTARRCNNLLLNGYFNAEEMKWLVDHAIDLYAGNHRGLIDGIFKLMGIYKEPSYIVE
jgi:hypothetical protein